MIINEHACALCSGEVPVTLYSVSTAPCNVVTGVLRMRKMAATLQLEGGVWGPRMEQSESKS